MADSFHFADLRELFAKANEEKSGDQLAGIAALSERERVAAKCALADLRLSEIVRNPLIDPDEDEVIEVDVVRRSAALQMIDDGRIQDAKTIVGLLRILK